MKEVLKTNREKMWAIEKEKMQKRMKRETIIMYSIIVVFVIGTCLLMYALCDLRRVSIENCVHNGKSYDECKKEVK